MKTLHLNTRFRTKVNKNEINTLINDIPAAVGFIRPFNVQQVECINWCGKTKTRKSASLVASIKLAVAILKKNTIKFEILIIEYICLCLPHFPVI